MSYSSFYDALKDALALDTGAGKLATMLGHSGTDNRISRRSQEVIAKKPFLAFDITDSGPAVIDSWTGWQMTEITFEVIYGTTQKSSGFAVAARLDDILHNSITTQTQQHKKFFDISNSNIANCSTRWKSRTRPEYDDKTDLWTIKIVADFFWYPKEG